MLGSNLSVTDKDGNYSFKNVVPGDYFLEIDRSTTDINDISDISLPASLHLINKENTFNFGLTTASMIKGIILLSEENKTQLWIPPGLAHGFVVLSDIADFEYKCTQYYNPKDEACLMWNDPDVAIQWPVEQPILSVKDQQGLSLQELV